MKFKCCPECPGDETCEHAKVCCCGNPMDKHALWDGHSPTSMHDYHSKPVPDYPTEGDAE